MREGELEKNAILGHGPMNMNLRKREQLIDAESAKMEAFGCIDEEKTAFLDQEYFRASMNAIRKMGDAMLTKTEFSKDLTEKISEKLRLDKRYLKIYKTTGTALDERHKISAWVEISGIGGKQIFVTLDVYTEEANKRKRADVIFKEPKEGFGKKDKEDYLAVLDYVATEVVNKMKNRGYNDTMLKLSKNEKDLNTDWGNLRDKRVVAFGGRDDWKKKKKR